MLDDKPAANLDRPKARLGVLKNRDGFQGDGAKRPLVVTIAGPEPERWEWVAGDLYVMTSP